MIIENSKLKIENQIHMSEKLEKMVKEVEGMSVLELNELVKAFEEKFGVSATAVAAPPPPPGTRAGTGEENTPKY